MMYLRRKKHLEIKCSIYDSLSTYTLLTLYSTSRYVWQMSLPTCTQHGSGKAPDPNDAKEIPTRQLDMLNPI